MELRDYVNKLTRDELATLCENGDLQIEVNSKYRKFTKHDDQFRWGEVTGVRVGDSPISGITATVPSTGSKPQEPKLQEPEDLPKLQGHPEDLPKLQGQTEDSNNQTGETPKKAFTPPVGVKPAPTLPKTND